MKEVRTEYNPLVSKFVSFYYKHLGVGFFKFQKLLFFLFFTVFFTTVIANFLVSWVLEDNQISINDLIVFIENLFIVILLWVITSIGTSIVWWLLVKLVNLDLWFYYYFWLPNVVPLLGRLNIISQDNLEILDLIKQSYPYEKKVTVSVQFLLRESI